MKKILLFLLAFCIVNADDEFNKNLENIYNLKEQLHIINQELKDNITIKNYKNYQEYIRLKIELQDLNDSLYRTKRNQREKIENRIKTLEDKINILKDYEHYSIVKYLNLPSQPMEHKKISNIYLVLEGLSEKKQLQNENKEYENKIKDFANLLSKIEQKNKLLYELNKLEPSDVISQELDFTKKELVDYKNTLENISSAYEIFKVKIANSIRLINNDIKKQYNSAIIFLAILLCMFVARYLVGLSIRNYVADKDRVYKSFKVLNIFTFFIVSLFSLFYFVENINYLVSVLGFASAGLAIAMKDMFMSLLGWVVLQFGGGFHVGDRIKVSKNGNIFIGDIVDISLLKMTIYEAVSLATYTQTRRAGRLIYIPNNYIFTELISKYNHFHMKTVWDGIDIMLEFSSNIDRAKQEILEAVTAHSQVFSESAKRAIQKMRNHYQMKNSGTDAKLFVFLEQYGVKISVWYMANSSEVLKIRSIISEDIIKRLKACDDIKLAFPSQTIYIDKRLNQPF